MGNKRENIKNFPVWVKMTYIKTGKIYEINGFLGHRKKYVRFYNPILKKEVEIWWDKIVNNKVYRKIIDDKEFLFTSNETDSIGQGWDIKNRYYDYITNPGKYKYRYSYLDMKLKDYDLDKHKAGLLRLRVKKK